MYMKLNNKIKLLALDVDGTLFDNAGQIPEKNDPCHSKGTGSLVR